MPTCIYFENFLEWLFELFFFVNICAIFQFFSCICDEIPKPVFLYKLNKTLFSWRKTKFLNQVLIDLFKLFLFNKFTMFASDVCNWIIKEGISEIIAYFSPVHTWLIAWFVVSVQKDNRQNVRFCDIHNVVMPGCMWMLWNNSQGIPLKNFHCLYLINYTLSRIRRGIRRNSMKIFSQYVIKINLL